MPASPRPAHGPFQLGAAGSVLGPSLAAAVVKTGAALAATIDDLGQAVAELLGHVEPGSRPRAR